MKNLLYILVCTVLFACAKKTSTKDYFVLRNNKADMPVYVEGNISSNTFIIVLHGGPGGNGMEMNAGKYSEILEQQYAMVYWDQRGQGNADGLRSNTKIEDLALDVQALLKVIEGRYPNSKKILFGHSWGGLLGTYALLNQETQSLVDAWIEADGAHDLKRLNETAIPMLIGVANQEINAESEYEEQWEEILDFANSVDINNISENESGQINQYGFQAEEYLRLPSNGRSQNDPTGFQFLFTSPTNPYVSAIEGNQTNTHLSSEIESTQLTSRLNEIKIPCLLLWGKYDFVVPAALGSDAMDRIANTNKQLVIFNESGHSPMDNEPESFCEAIINFISGL